MSIPDLSTCGLNVKTFGALGDGKNDDAAAIQTALDAGSPLVVIPFGKYLISQTLRIRSHTRLHVHPLAVIQLADHAGKDQSVFLITNANPADGDEHIEIEGGIWDGNNPANPRGPDQPGSYTGVGLNFMKVQYLTLRNLRVRDAESYNIRIGEVRHFRIEGIRFEAAHLRPNQDGVHLCGYCEDGVIRNISARGKQCTNDDLVALVADDAMERAQNLGGKCGPIRRLRIENLSADDCHSFVRLGCVWSPITDIEIDGVIGGCRCTAVNADALRYCKVPVFDRHDARFANGVGRLENIELANFFVHRTDSREALLLLETRMKNFRIRNFRRNLEKEAYADAPTLRVRNVVTAELLLSGLTSEDVTELQTNLSAKALKLSTLATPQAQARYRAVVELDHSDTLDSHASVLDLTVEQSVMDEIPEPPKGWHD